MVDSSMDVYFMGYATSTMDVCMTTSTRPFYKYPTMGMTMSYRSNTIQRALDANLADIAVT
jgi:hypothetical protein